MTVAKEAADDLLSRLIASERPEEASLHLAMLLEKSCCSVANGEGFYREILPPQLSDLRLSPEECADVVSRICKEVLRSPSEGLIASVSFTSADLPTQTAVKLLTSPPRRLSLGELDGALSLVHKFLPFSLSQNPDFIPRVDLEGLVKVAEQLQNIQETGTGPERSAQIGIKYHAAGLLADLKLHGTI